MKNSFRLFVIDFYVIYNRAKGMNDGVLQTNFAPNQVRVR
jgi:hypothetical protein